MNSSVPEFGVAVEGQNYALRPGAYGVLRDVAGRVAVVMTPVGGFLPGGGQVAGESPKQALKREFAEETGVHVQAGREIGVADELVYSKEEAAYFRKRGMFYEALRAVEESAAEGVEPDHRVIWLPASEAMAVLLHGSHKWAVRALLAEPPNGGPAASAAKSGVTNGPPSVT